MFGERYFGVWEEGCCIRLSSSVLESFVFLGVLVSGSGEGVVGLCGRCMRVCLSCPYGPVFLGL